MIGRDHPCLRFVKPLLTLAITNRSRHMLRDSRIAQPERSTGVVQSAILRDERMTGCRITDAGWRDRQRTVKAPGYEQVLTFRLEAPVNVSTERASAAFRYVEPGDYQQAELQRRPPPTMHAGPPAPYYGSPYYYYGPSYYPYYYGPSIGFYYGRGYYRGWRR